MDDGKDLPGPNVTEEEPKAELKEEQTDGELVEGYDPFCKVKELLEQGDFNGAQELLDGFDERGGEWHYIQSRIYQKRNWFSLSKVSLERALSFEPENEEYQRALDELENMAQSGKKSRKKKKTTRTMGGKSVWDACIEGGCECCTMVGCELCCEAICDGLGGC